MKKRSVYIAILALVLVSCERENDLPTTPAALSFIPSVSGEALTKAAPYEGTAFPREISMGLMACSYTDSHAQPSTWTMHTSPSVVEAVHDGSRGEASEKWVPTTRVLWPGSGYVRFFAYAPFGAEGLSVTASDGTAPQLNFTVNADYSKQVDLLVANEASTRQYDGKPPVTEIDIPMTFNHVLTGIRFRVENGLAISSITVEGVYDKASLNLAAGGHNWIPDESSSGTYTLVSPSLKDDPSRTGFQVVDDVYTLLLLPQTLPAGARIVAEATNAVGSKTITALMAGEIWEPGKIITYTIAENAQMGSL